MANTVILGQVRPVNKGPWSATTTYTVMQRVTHNAVLWEAQKDVPMGTVPEKDSEYWYPISAMDVEEIPVDEFVNTTSDQVIGGKKDFSGEVLLKTPNEGDDSRRAANTKYVQGELTKKADDDAVVKLEGDQVIEGKKDFHGEVLVPTLDSTDNSQKAASTAFVQNVLGELSDIDGSQLVNIAGDQIITGKKQFTGETLVQTPDVTDNSQKAANTAFVRSLIEQSGAGEEGRVTLTGTQTITGNKIFDGQILVPTQPTGDSTRKAASTAFVQDALAQELESFQQSVTAAETAAENAETYAENALPRSGGEMTGPIYQKTDFERNELPATDVLKIPFVVKDASDKLLIQCLNQANQNYNALKLRVFAPDVADKIADIGLFSMADGSVYATCPPPRGLYNNDIATFKSLVDYAAKNPAVDFNVHIGGENASDTADLNDGRGLSAEMPFASFDAAVVWVCSRFASSIRNINLFVHEDMIWNSGISSGNLRSLTITTVNNAILSVGQNALVRNGNVSFQNCKLHAENVPGLIRAEGAWGQPLIYIGTGVELTGTVTRGAVCASYGGSVFMLQPFVSTSSVTGPRYRADQGAKIVRESTSIIIPGTADGFCDSSSVYA